MSVDAAHALPPSPYAETAVLPSRLRRLMALVRASGCGRPVLGRLVRERLRERTGQ